MTELKIMTPAVPILVLHPKDWREPAVTAALNAGYQPIMADVSTTRVLAPTSVLFTRKDIDLLSEAAGRIEGEDSAQVPLADALMALAARIEAILPPEGP